MSSRHSSSDGASDDATDPSAIILPHIETDEDILLGYDLSELVLFIPPTLFGLVGVTTFLGGNLFLAGIFAFPAVIGGLLAMYFAFTSTWYAPPRERLRDAVKYLRSRWETPLGHDEAVGAVHGVRSIDEDGTAKCRDGRYAVAVPVYGTNTDQVDGGTITQLVGGLRQGVNMDLQKDWFALYSTTRSDSTEDRATAWENRAMEENDDDLTPFQEMALLDGAEWLRDRDEDWQANDWGDFIELQVFPHEYDVTQEELDAQSDDDSGGMLNAVAQTGSWLTGIVSRDLALPEDESGGVRTPEDVLEDRMQRVGDAISGIEGVQLGEPSPAATADLLAEHWTGGGHVTGEDLERLVAPGRETLGEFTPTERLLTPDRYDNLGTTMAIDDMLARTYWISEWPMEPQSLFLRDLHTMDDINLSVRIIADPDDKQDVINDLEVVIARARGEEQRREDEGEVSSLAIVDDIDALEQAYHTLQQTNAQSWRLSAYVTVRAETRSELREASTKLKKTLESYPANCTPVAHGTRQRAVFASGAPFAPNVFERDSKADKYHRTLSGAFGAMFPFVRTSIHEPDGIRWGRNTQTGQSLWADPFDRGSSPHLITIGKSRGGKTYGVSQAVAEWWMAKDDRTLILCDTQGGFDGLTELLDGDHIVVDSSTGVNPFHIETSATEAEQPFGLKIDEVTEFMAGILRAQNIDASEFKPTIELAVQKTYARHEIYPGDIPDDPDIPTIGDFIDTLGMMIDNPSEYSHTDHESVADKRKDKVSDLLEKLTGFMESGKYSYLVDETDPGITPETRMAYLDLQHFDDKTDAEKSVHLHLMLSQVSQLIKRTPGETIFVIDEAHLLLHSDEMLEYLQAATREWARYKAAMWFVSQSPQEFVRRSSDTEQGQENHRQVILQQCSTTQVFYCGTGQGPSDEGGIGRDTLLDIGMFPELTETAQNKLTRGKQGKGYSECLLDFDDETGWIMSRVEAPPLLDLILSYKSHEHGDFIEYLRMNAGEDIARMAAESRSDLVQEALAESESDQQPAPELDAHSPAPATEEVRTNGNGHHDSTVIDPNTNDSDPSISDEIEDESA